MAFKRMEGFAGSVPQGFIDRNVPICPLCGSRYPHWALDQKMQMKLEGNLYLFQCEQCKGVLSSPVPDVTGYNNTMITTTGLLKKMSGKENGVIYMRVEDAGTSGCNEFLGREFKLQELNAIASQKGGQNADAMVPPAYTPAQAQYTAPAAPVQPQAQYAAPAAPVQPQAQYAAPAAPVQPPMQYAPPAAQQGAYANASFTAEQLMNVVMPAVCAQLKAPASARFPTELVSITGNDVQGYQVNGFVDSQNTYGAMIRNDFSATVIIQNGTPVVTKANVAVKANAERAKQFGINYVALSIIIGVIAIASTALMFFIISMLM